MNRNYLLLVVLLCVAAYGGLYYHTSQEAERYEDKAIPWLVSTMYDISSWEPADLYDKLAPEAKAAVTQEQLENVLVRYRPLGRFESLEAMEFSRLAAVMSLFSSEQKIGYSGVAQFANARASLTVTLSEKNGRFMLYNINLAQVQKRD